MKRGSDSGLPSTPTKRRRASAAQDSDSLDSEALFSDPSRACTIEDALLGGDFSPASYITGTVVMRLTPIDGHTWFILKTTSGTKLKAEFRGKCSPYLDLLQGTFREKVKLALKGAKVIHSESSDPTLLYEQGASLVFVESRDSRRVGKVIDTWALDQAAAQVEETGLAHSDYVEGDDWYDTPSRSRRRPPDDAPLPSASTTEAAASNTETEGVLPLAQQELVPSLLAASTSGFSPSVQLAATRRSTSIALPVITTSHADNTPRAKETASGADSEKTSATRPPDVSAEVLSTKPNPDAQIRDAPVHNPTIVHASHVTQPQSEATTGTIPTRAASNEDKPQSGQGSVLLGKKQLKRRARREKQRSVHDGKQTSANQSRTSLPTESCLDTDTAVALSRRSDTQAPPDARQEQPASDDAEATSSTRASGPSRAPHSPKSVEQVPSRSQPLQDAGSSRSPPFPIPSQPERKPEVAKRSPSSASTRVTPKTEAVDGPQTLLAGFRSEYAFYSPLARVERKDKVYNVIAVVASAGFVSQTSTGEYKTVLSLTDPSVHGQGDFSVNMFAKRSTHLPEPACGDVIMIRGVLGDFYRQKCGTAPSYKSWTWAIVDPRTREPIRKKEDICFQPTPSELQRCAALGEWWASVAAAQDLGTVHQIRPVRTGRIHRLLSEASPECEPDGFFDCTVEVLYGHENTNGIYSLYVTDYTHNPDMVPIDRDWCPPSLSDKVLKLELFQEAALKGPEMKAGEYYFIGNCRMKRSTGGYLEATFSQVNKMRKLDEDALEDEPRLVDLLKRKAEWQAKVEASGGAHEFPHRLFREAESNKHFQCTAEVLLVSPKEGMAYLYVTDYTSRDDLVPVAFTVPRALQLKDCIVKIALHDDQAETAKQLEAGDFVAIRNLRLRPSGSEQKLVMGRLGGSQRLLSKLQPNSPNNHELQALLMRKEEFEAKRSAAKGGPSGNKRKTGEPPPQETVVSRLPRSVSTGSANTVEHETRQYSSIAQVKESAVCPGKFLVRARIVDFYPPKVSAFRVRKCTQCRATISDIQRVCTMCDDPMDPDNRTSVKAYWNFALEVEDEHEDCLQLFSCDDECSIVKGLDPEGLGDDDDTAKELSQRLRRLCGDLVELREDEACRRMETTQAEQSQWLSLVLGSYSPEVRTDTPCRQYILLDYEIAV